MLRFTLLSIACVFLGVTGCGNDSYPLPAEIDVPIGSFSAGPDLSKPRFEHASVVLPDGRVIVCGGADPKSKSWEAFAELEIFNLSTNQWRDGPTMIQGRFAHQAVVLDDGNMAVFGGKNNAVLVGCAGNTPGGFTGKTPYLCNTEIFNPNPAQEGWSTKPEMDMVYPRIHFSAMSVKQGAKVVVAGGTAQEFPQKYELFDAYTRTWDDISAPQNGIRAFHAGIALPNEDILLIGGSTKSKDEVTPNPLREVDRFNVDAKIWTSAGSINVQRQYHTATSLGDGRVLIAGGAEFGTNVTHSSTEIYDETTNTWSFRTPMHEKRQGHAAALLIGGRRVLVVGGISESDGKPMMLESAEILDLETMTWTKIETPFARRWQPTMHVLPTDGRVLILGGATVSTENINGNETTVITPLRTTTFFTPPCASHFECAPGYRCGVERECIKVDTQSN